MTRRRSRDSGAITIMALFGTMLLTGAVFSVYGVGRAIRHGEGVHDAADAVAFAGGVLDAHALNLISLFNLTKASVVALSLRQKAGSAGQAAGQEILQAITEAEAALTTGMAGYADQVADTIARGHGQRTGFFAPPRPLPLAPEEKPVFCARVLALLGVGPPPGPPPVQSPGGALPPAAKPGPGGKLQALCLAQPVTATRLLPEAVLGSAALQRQGYALGAALDLYEDDGVRLATWRGDEEVGEVARLRENLSQLGLAQAEAYLDAEAPPADLLWHPRWRARLRRFRDQDDFAAFLAACAKHGGDAACAPITQALVEAETLLIH